MDRRRFLTKSALGMLALGAAPAVGCRSKQHAQVLRPDQADLVGNTAAGAETYKPLVDEAVARLLGQHQALVQPVSTAPQPVTICFVGVENQSSEELGDFKNQIYEMIDTRLQQSNNYRQVSRRFVETGLRETRLRPDQLLIPQYMRTFSAVMEQYGQPIDGLLFAKITSGTTRNDNAYQRDYVLTLELVDVHTGLFYKEQAEIRKGYERSHAGPLAKTGWFSWW